MALACLLGAAFMAMRAWRTTRWRYLPCRKSHELLVAELNADGALKSELGAPRVAEHDADYYAQRLFQATANFQQRRPFMRNLVARLHALPRDAEPSEALFETLVDRY